MQKKKMDVDQIFQQTEIQHICIIENIFVQFSYVVRYRNIILRRVAHYSTPTLLQIFFTPALGKDWDDTVDNCPLL